MNRHHSLGLQAYSLEWTSHIIAEAQLILPTEEVGKCFVTLSLICDLHAFIQQVPLLEPGYQKLSIGLGRTKVSDQIVEVFLVSTSFVVEASDLHTLYSSNMLMKYGDDSSARITLPPHQRSLSISL